MKTRSLWTSLTTQRLLMLLPVALLFAVALAPVDETDLWWHLKAGEWMLVHRALPRVGLWSWVGETRPWVTHEWLFEVVSAALFRLGGAGAMILAKSLCIATLFALLQKHALLRAGSLGLAAAVTVVAGIASWPFWSERPQLITYALATWFLLVLDQWQRGERRHVWMLAPGVMIWSNFHGGFILAFLLLAIYAVGEAGSLAWARGRGERAAWARVWHLGQVGGVAALLAMVNPNGPQILLYPFRYAGSNWLTRFVAEWQSPNFHEAHFQIVALYLLTTFAVLIVSPRRPRAAEVLLVMVLTFMGLHSLRNLPLAVLASAPILAEHLRALGDLVTASRSRSQQPAATTSQFWAANWTILALIALFVAVQADRCRREPVHTTRLPTGAVRYLQRHFLPGRMFNHYDWGGYLIWTLAPRYQVFIDGRLDIYGPRVAKDYSTVHYVQPKWQEVLDRYQIDWVLWRWEEPLAQVLAVHPNWQMIYRDSQAVIFVRRSGPKARRPGA